MEKEKSYIECRFSAETIKEAMVVAKNTTPDSKDDLLSLSVDHDDNSSWRYDTLEEFLADYRKFNGYASLRMYIAEMEFGVRVRERETTVSMKTAKRSDIEEVFNVFEKYLNNSKLEPIPKPKPAPIKPVIFIGHGRNPAWRDLKDHLHDKHDLKIEAYETGARAGHTIRDILEDMITKSSFALLVLTNEDEQSDGAFRARQNVIHEAGLFQGNLGFSKAILLLEEGVEEFSNVQGVQYIRFSKNNIKETFGEILATLRREFPIPG